MIIFLYGEDSYRSRQKLKEIIDRYKESFLGNSGRKKSGLSFLLFNGKEADFQDFSNSFKAAPLFKEKKLIIIKNIFTNPGFQENFLKNAQDFINSKDIILIYEDGRVDEKNKLFKFLRDKAKSQEFKFLTGGKLKNWVKKEFERFKAKINSETLDFFINYTGNESWRIVNEIQKLANYKRLDYIEKKDVILLVKPVIETDIFKTIDAISQKNKSKALLLIKEHLGGGDSPLYLLSMINFQFRNILMVKSAKNAKIKGLHVYVLRKALLQSQKFTLQDLKVIYRKIFETDIKIKTGKIDPETALDLLVAEI